MTNYNDGKWHGWNGGECPVHPETVVEYRVADRWVHDLLPLKASYLRWRDDKGLVAFRVIKEHKEPREWWIRSVAPEGFMTDCRPDDAGAIHVREVTQ